MIQAMCRVVENIPCNWKQPVKLLIRQEEHFVLLLGQTEKERFAEIMRQLENFLGARVVSFALTINHFRFLHGGKGRELPLVLRAESGYGAAVGGDQTAREGLGRILDASDTACGETFSAD